MDLFEWAEQYVTTTVLAEKLVPPPMDLTLGDDRPAAKDLRPGRPPEFVVEAKAKKAKTKGALVHLGRRAELFHRFFHHELQAAELMAWAICRFPNTPAPFLRGLRKIAEDEVAHAILYANYVQDAGVPLGSLPVRDWFWERVPLAQTPEAYCAVMGLGFEGGNLDHTRRFQADFASAGDDRALAIVAQVHDEEISHVRFGLHWFRKFTGVAEVPTGPAPTGEVQGSTPFDDFAHWRNTLPHPLSPVLMKGVPLDLEARRKAGMGEEFLTRLDKWTLDDR